jgi:uncharacterized membrane protein (UPF0127 family)
MLSRMRKASEKETRSVPRLTAVLSLVVVLLLIIGAGLFLQSQPSLDNSTQGVGIEKECLELGQDICIDLEIVDTPESRQLGLSNRESLPAEAGLLFDFETEIESCMWMKGMKFSLDMIWIDGQGKIVYIKRDISPDTFPQSFCGVQPARYVLEINAGVADAAGAVVGQQLSLDTLMLR